MIESEDAHGSPEKRKKKKKKRSLEKDADSDVEVPVAKQSKKHKKQSRHSEEISVAAVKHPSPAKKAKSPTAIESVKSQEVLSNTRSLVKKSTKRHLNKETPEVHNIEDEDESATSGDDARLDADMVDTAGPATGTVSGASHKGNDAGDAGSEAAPDHSAVTEELDVEKCIKPSPKLTSAGQKARERRKRKRKRKRTKQKKLTPGQQLASDDTYRDKSLDRRSGKAPAIQAEVEKGSPATWSAANAKSSTPSDGSNIRNKTDFVKPGHIVFGSSDGSDTDSEGDRGVSTDQAGQNTGEKDPSQELAILAASGIQGNASLEVVASPDGRSEGTNAQFNTSSPVPSETENTGQAQAASYALYYKTLQQLKSSAVCDRMAEQQSEDGKTQQGTSHIRTFVKGAFANVKVFGRQNRQKLKKNTFYPLSKEEQLAAVQTNKSVVLMVC